MLEPGSKSGKRAKIAQSELLKNRACARQLLLLCYCSHERKQSNHTVTSYHFLIEIVTFREQQSAKTNE